MPANQQQPTIPQLKKRALALVALPRNQGWLELSRVLDLLHGHRGERGRAEFQDVIRAGKLSRRAAYYLLKVNQLIRTAKLSTSKAERIGWTKLQIIGNNLNAKNASRLLNLAEEKNAQELKRLISKKHSKPKPHCVQLYFTTEQYQQFKKAVLLHGGRRTGRGLTNTEGALIKAIQQSRHPE